MSCRWGLKKGSDRGAQLMQMMYALRALGRESEPYLGGGQTVSIPIVGGDSEYLGPTSQPIPMVRPDEAYLQTRSRPRTDNAPVRRRGQACRHLR